MRKVRDKADILLTNSGVKSWSDRTNTDLVMSFMRLFKPAKRDQCHTSVVLKRQIPIRFDEQPHSWLGGLPMMPDTVDWPRDSEGSPLHFLAQISCSQLPAELWSGKGPREGWLLYFIETMKFEDEAGPELIRILHINALGPEREPPDDMPTVRHTMSDYIDYATPNIRPGVPKLWRKWPVDLVLQKYQTNDAEEDFAPPPISAEALYGAAVAENGMTGRDKYGVDRPLTWRGVLYFIERVLHDLDPSEFERKFCGSFGLLDAPEGDKREFSEELQKRINANPACADRDVGWGPRVEAVKVQIEADLQEERSTGWMKRAYVSLDKTQARLEGWRDQYQTELDEKGAELDASARERLAEQIAYQIESIEKVAEDRAYLDDLFAPYPGPDGEQKLTAEIRALGEAHLAWGAEMAVRADKCLRNVLSQDLEASVPADDWNEILAQFSQPKSVHWSQAGSKCLRKVETGLALDQHLTMAIREDILDLYTRDETALQSHGTFQRDVFEEQMRYIDPHLPHRIGGHPNPVQGEGPRGYELMLQLGSDAPMGWVWGDLGAVYVMTSPSDVKKGRFKKIFATLEGH